MQLITIYNTCCIILGIKSQTYVAILEFLMTFDTVLHAGLLRKLEHYGIDRAHESISALKTLQL